jgi:hypothetical protein
MWGNFDERQNLKHSDETVDTRGWLQWDADDQSAVMTITVTQDGYECTGPPIACSPNDDTWKVDVTRAAPPPWSRGAASGTAAGVVTKNDGTTYDVNWDSPPLTLH